MSLGSLPAPRVMPAEERPEVGRVVVRDGARLVEVRLGCGRAAVDGVRTVRVIDRPDEASRGVRVVVASAGRVGR